MNEEETMVPHFRDESIFSGWREYSTPDDGRFLVMLDNPLANFYRQHEDREFVFDCKVKVGRARSPKALHAAYKANKG